MPHAKTCVTCGAIISAHKTRCPCCEAKRNATHNRARDFYRSPAWRRLSKRVTANGCAICGSHERVAAHHIIPRKKGGADDESNLIALCHKHHMEVEAQA